MSTPISRADVEHLAGLARIQLSDDELDHLAAELPAILDHVAAVQQTVQHEEQGGVEVPAMSHPLPVDNVFRADEVVPPLTADAALAGAPESQDQRFVVPKILGKE